MAYLAAAALYFASNWQFVQRLEQEQHQSLTAVRDAIVADLVNHAIVFGAVSMLVASSAFVWHRLGMR